MNAIRVDDPEYHPVSNKLVNWKVRLKNPYFWLGLVGVILSAMGVEASMLTSWAALWDSIVSLFSNPFMLGSVIAAIVGVITDPTTKGLGDSKRAKEYTKPYQD